MCVWTTEDGDFHFIAREGKDCTTREEEGNGIQDSFTKK